MNDFSNFISYFEAKQYLEVKLYATQDEVAQWVSIGEKEGGLDAYTINESENPTLFTFNPSKFINDDDYIKPLEKLYFLPGDIEQFQPARRYITRSALIKRWEERYQIETDNECYDDEDEHEDESIIFFEARINESCFSEYHPIAGVVASTGQLFRSGLFDINDVQRIEATYNHKKSAGYHRALRYLQRKKESDNKVLGECDEDDYIDMDEYELERIRVLEELYKSVVSGEVKFSLVPYDEFMGFSEQEPDKKCGFIYRNNNPTIPIEPTAPKYGEPELLLSDAIILALLLLGDWEADELALHVFNGTVRAFEKSIADRMLRPVVNIQDWLIQYGKCVSFDDKQYSIKKALAMFNYSKSELSQFKPRNRYISFPKAIALMPGQGTRDIDAAEMYLINALEVGKIYAFHFFVGHVTPKLSMDGEYWRNGYFAEWQFNRLIARDFDEQEMPEPLVNTVEVDSTVATKPRKKLKPMKREASLVLLLLYKIFDRYNVNYDDDLPGLEAWGKIMSKDFKSESIKSISDAKTYITLTDGSKLYKQDFLEKYRKRFEF